MERDSNVGAVPETTCPAEQVILDLALGVLPAEDRRQTWAHIERCGDCARLIGAALPFLGPETPGQNAWQSAWRRSTEGGASAGGMDATERGERSLQPGQLLRDRYRVVRYIGRGGMGEVYEASHVRLVGRYAVKILNVDLSRNQTAQQRFEREAAIASELRHANIVQVFDFDETDDGRPYFVMELLDGRDLGALIAEGPMPIERVLSLARQMAAGLAAMHERGIVHRDLKPANVFVLPAVSGEPERVKLLDFGLSKRLAPELRVTHDRMLLGTPQYMAPEQARANAEDVGAPADQFAMGAIVYEMLSGRPAFDGDLLSVVLYRIVHEPPAPLADLVPDLAPSLIAAIERALAKDPRARFPSVTAFLEALAAGARDSARLPRRPRRSAKSAVARRRRWLAWSGGGVVGAGIGLAIILISHRRTMPEAPPRPQASPVVAAQPPAAPAKPTVEAGERGAVSEPPVAAVMVRPNKAAAGKSKRAAAPRLTGAAPAAPGEAADGSPAAVPAAASGDEVPPTSQPPAPPPAEGKPLVPHL